jgi:hypothetical protein
MTQLGKYNTDQISGNKRTVLYIGAEKTGKTYNAFSGPAPSGIYTDHNQDTLAEYPCVKYDSPTTFKQLEEIVRELELRTAPFETVVVDGFSVLSQMRKAEIQGIGSMDIQKWGSLFDDMLRVTGQLLALAHPTDNHPGYHVVGTCHINRMTDKDGALLEYRPHIQGQFGIWLPRMFNTILGTDFKTDKVITGTGPGKKIEYSASYVVYTSPPNNYWKLGGGFASKLPPVTSGLFKDLSKAWT